MEQFEQLLTCAICLDRYRNPKLLPCQHSFCMEPCMDGLVDYVRRQVKCPECRAEHRIPYQGVQGYPTNVTLQRFLELHIEITGELPDPTSGQVMERCGVCSEKSYCTPCGHCDKKICQDCKGAHMDILRREISRINNQVRRALHRLQDMLAMVDKNLILLQQNCGSVAEEVDEIDRRLAKSLKDRTEHLRQELDRYLTTEVRNLTQLKENLELEISNITSNCDLADKHMTEAVDWDDCELMDAKEIFLKTVEFIRNFETETGDYQRRVRFVMAHDPNQLVHHVAGYGDLNINQPHSAAPGAGLTGSASMGLLQTPGPGLMRSKSDHRLATQFRQQEERGGYDEDPRGGRLSPLAGRKFGERPAPRPAATDRYEGRYGREREGGYGATDYGDYDAEGGSRAGRSKYRSRFRRDAQEAAEPEPESGRAVRFQEQQHRERERVLDTEDVSKGPLSGITRLYDVPRVMKRLQESELKEKNKGKEPLPQPPQPQQLAQQPKKTVTQRQVSEEDEITKIKRQNKGGSSSTAASEPSAATEPREAAAATPPRPAADRVAALKKAEEERRRGGSREGSSDNDSDDGGSSGSSMQGSARSSPQGRRKSLLGAAPPRRGSAGTLVPARAEAKADAKPRSGSTDSTASSESSTGSAVRNTGAVFTTEELKQKYLSRGSAPGSSPPAAQPAESRARPAQQESTPPRFQSRFSGSTRGSSQAADKPKQEEDDDDSTESSSEEETDSDEEEDKAKKDDVSRMDIGPLLARSANARDTASATRRDSRDETAVSGQPRQGEPPQQHQQSNQQQQQQQQQAPSPSTSSEPSSNPPGPPGPLAQPRPWRQSRPWLAQQPPKPAPPPLAPLSPEEILDLPESTSPRGPSPTNLLSKALPTLEQTKQSVNRFLRRSRGGFGRSTGTSSATATTGRYGQTEPPSSASSYRSPLSREDNGGSGYRSQRTSRDEDTPSTATSRYGTSTSASTTTTPSSYTSRFLNKSKSTAAVDDDESARKASAPDESTRYPSGRSRYAALKERRSRLARSRSSHNMGGGDEGEDVEDYATTTSPSAYLASRGYGSASSSELARSRSTHALKSRDNSPERTGEKDGTALSSWARSRARPTHANNSPERGEKDPTTTPSASAISAYRSRARQAALKSRETSPERGPEKDGNSPALSSWARYLKNKYGPRKEGKDGAGSSASTGGTTGAGASSAASASSSRRLSLGLPLSRHNSASIDSSDDDQKNPVGSPTSPTAATAAAAGFAAGATSPRSQYLQKRRQLFQIGSRGSEPGAFTWPRGIAVGPDNTIVIADSSNHRVQVFDANGVFVKEFGSYGNGEGEFDCLAGVAVNRIGQFIIADRYNHRIQVMDPSGRFLRAFGSQGTADGRFNYPWGITTDALGFIYVCDKENHRVQVFQSDGTFVGKFGSCGRGPGQLEHPHYIAVSSTNRVIVSDSNNHRIQIFDVNGRVITSFGSEGSEEGQFKFPRGVAVDDQGFIFVGDSGNNRIQIFHPDGAFLRAFGCWGAGPAEFKGLEGVAVMSDGKIMVCDRENHRVQVF